MKTKLFLAIFVSAIFLSFSLFAAKKEYEHLKPPPIPQNLKDLQKLTGVWEGMNQTHKGKQMVRVSYFLTSGNSALIEQMFKGTPEEMVSIYHANGDKVMMTHYCMLGNQPRMKLKKREKNTYYFDFKDGTNMKRRDPHMHSLKLTLVNQDHLRHEWTMYEKRKPKETVVFNFKRKK